MEDSKSNSSFQVNNNSLVWEFIFFCLGGGECWGWCCLGKEFILTSQYVIHINFKASVLQMILCICLFSFAVARLPGLGYFAHVSGFSGQKLLHIRKR